VAVNYSALDAQDSLVPVDVRLLQAAELRTTKSEAARQNHHRAVRLSGQFRQQRAKLVRGEHIRLCPSCPALPNAGNGILFDQLPSRSTLEKNVQHIPYVQFAFGSEMQVSQPLLNSHRAHMLKRVLSPLLFYPIVKEALGSSSSLNTLSGPGDFTH
jgi:hypothetical protein